MEKERTKAIRCPQCGAVDVTVLTEDLAKCNMCGASIAIEKEKSQVNVKNEFNVQYGSDKTVEYYTVKKEYDSANFLRNTYISLASDVRTPDDIIDGKFSPVSSKFEQYLTVSGDADISYTVNIGYDVKEEVASTESKFVAEGDFYTYKGVTKRATKSGTQIVDCVKEKTVTKWEPFSGTYSDSYTKCVSNEPDEKRSPLEGFFSSALSTAKSESLVPFEEVDFEAEAPKAPLSDAVETAKIRIRSACEYAAKKNLPGDRNKDFKASGTVDVKEICSVSAPVYSVKYEYGGKQIINKSFAFGAFNRVGGTVDVSQKLMDVVNKRTRPFDIAAIIAFSTNLVLMIMCMMGVLSKLLLIFSAACIGLKIFTHLYYKKLINNIVAINQENKKQKLKSILAKNKLKALSAEEEKSFAAKGTELPKTKHKIRTAGSVLFWIALFLSFMSLTGF